MKSPLVRAVLLIALMATATLAAGVTVPITDDLQAEGELAQERRVPLLVMFYSEHCYYCTRVEEDFLEPILISGDYTDKVIIRRVDLVNSSQITDFDGTPISVSDLAARYKVRVTPTLVYVNGEGQQLAEKMVGLTTPDFYGDYIDRRIDTALHNLGKDPAHADVSPSPGRNSK